jgi:K+-sensing histidine kinase KdpD
MSPPTATETSTARAPVVEPEVVVHQPRAPLVPLAGFIGLLGLSVVFDPTHVHVGWEVSFAVFAAAVVSCAAVSTPIVALLLSVCAWLDFDGFVVGHEGTLRWHGTTDVLRVGVLVGCAVLTFLVKHRVAISRARR